MQLTINGQAVESIDITTDEGGITMRMGLGLGLTAQQSGGAGIETLAIPGDPFPVTLQRSATEYSVAETIDQIAPTYSGSTWYVNAATGNDTTGDGSSGTPYATMQKAITEATALDIISVAPGVVAFPTSAITKSLKFVRTGASGTVYVGAFFDGSAGVFVTVDLTQPRYRANTADGHPQYRGVIRRDLAGTYGIQSTKQVGGSQMGGLSSLGYFNAAIGTGTMFFHVGTDVSTLAAVTALRDAGNLLFWSAANNGTFSVTGTGTEVYVTDGFVMASDTLTANCGAGATLYVSGCEFVTSGNLSTDDVFNVDGLIVLYGTKINGSVNNNIDYSAGGKGVEVGITSVFGSMNASTSHGGPALRVGGVYAEASKAIHDQATVYNFGMTIVSNSQTAQFAMGVNNTGTGLTGDTTYGDVTLIGTFTTNYEDFGYGGFTVVELGTAWPY